MNASMKLLGVLCLSLFSFFSCTKDTITTTAEEPVVEAEVSDLSNFARRFCCPSCDVEIEMHTFNSYAGGTLTVFTQDFCVLGEVEIPVGQNSASATVSIRGESDGNIYCAWNSNTSVRLTKFSHDCSGSFSLSPPVTINPNGGPYYGLYGLNGELGQYSMCTPEEDDDNPDF